MISDNLKKQIVASASASWREISYDLGGCDALDALDFVVSHMTWVPKEVKEVLKYGNPDYNEAIEIIRDYLSKYFPEGSSS